MKIIAHRGLSASYPENTLLAFEKAIELGVDAIEMDLRLSEDGEIFIFHDSSLLRVTGESGSIESHKRSYLKSLDSGSWFNKAYGNERLPTLKEVLASIKGRCQIILEIKYELKTYQELCLILEKEIAHLGSWVEVSSFSDAVLNFLHSLNPHITLHKLIDDESVFQNADFDKIYHFISYFDIDISLQEHKKTKELLSRKKVIFWVIDDEDISQSVSKGLYAAMSNDPQMLKKFKT